MRVVSCKFSVVPVTDTSPPRPRRLLALTTLVPLIITLVPPGIGLKGDNGSEDVTCSPGVARSCTWPPRASPSTDTVLWVTLNSRLSMTTVPPVPATLLADSAAFSSFTAWADSRRISPPRTAPSARTCDWGSSAIAVCAVVTEAEVLAVPRVVGTGVGTPALLACSSTLPPAPCVLETSIAPAFSMRCAWMCTSPPCVGPLACSTLVALSCTLPLCNKMRPPCRVKLLALSWPLLMIWPVIASNAVALRMIKPSGACTAVLFSIKVAIKLGLTVMLANLLAGSKLSLMASAPAMTTVPCWATIKPSLRTCGASSAT